MGTWWVWLSAALLVIGLMALLWRRVAPSPVARKRESRLAKLSQQVEAGRVGQFVEDRIGGASEVTGMRLLLLFLGVVLTGFFLLVPIFGYGTPIVAVAMGMLAGWVYVQNGARKRRTLLEEQTLRLAAVLAAALKGGGDTGTYIDLLMTTLKEIGAPLDDDLGATFRNIRAGADYQGTLAALQQMSQSRRLRKLAGLFLLVEDSDLGPEQQQEIFGRFYHDELGGEGMVREIRVLTAQSRFSLAVVTALLPLMLAARFAMRGEIMRQYIADPFGQTVIGFGLLLGLVMVVFALRMMRPAEEV